MHRKNLREKLERYHPSDEIEKADREKMLDIKNHEYTWLQRFRL